MKYGLLIGWGIVMYAVMFLAWSGFVTYGFIEGILPRIATLLLLIFLAILAGRSLKLHLWTDIAPYSVFWAIMMALFDAIFVVPFSGWIIYRDPSLWFGYAVVVIVPLLAPKLRQLLDVPAQSHDRV